MLSDGEIVTNQTKYRELSKEYAELEPVVQNYVAYQAVLADIQAATLLAKDLDRDMREMAEEEILQGEARKGELESILAKLLLPRDPNDHKNVFLEIRAGAGGDGQGRGDRGVPALSRDQRRRPRAVLQPGSAARRQGRAQAGDRDAAQGARRQARLWQGVGQPGRRARERRRHRRRRDAVCQRGGARPVGQELHQPRQVVRCQGAGRALAAVSAEGACVGRRSVARRAAIFL